MLIIKDEITEELERIKQELKRLGRMKIIIGIQGVAGENAEGEMVKASADIMTIAGIHEFGATIKAKNVRNLAIPIAKKAVGKSPLDFDNLFFIRSMKGFYSDALITKKEKIQGCQVGQQIRNLNPRSQQIVCSCRRMMKI